MKLEKELVYNELVKKGAKELYHANSVLTSLQFLKKSALISRGKVEQYGLPQTPQSSDNIDKQYGIWFDIFTDNVDIHSRASGVNLYGPVMFVLDTNIIKDDNVNEVWITKNNPTNWPKLKEENRWFNSEKDFKDNFNTGTFAYMLVFRDSSGEIPFTKYLKKIVLDDPDLIWANNKKKVYETALSALTLAIKTADLNISIEKRICSSTCDCKNFYRNNHTKAGMWFKAQD